MEGSSNIIAAFSEEQAERLTGVTKHQLRNWDRTGFYIPSFAEDNRRMSFSRIYSFRDIVALRILNVLRNQYGVSLQHLRQTSKRLSQFGPDPERWIANELYVLNKRVIWHEPGTELPQDVATKQYIVPTISLQKVVNDTKRDLEKRRSSRDSSTIGKIIQNRHINHNMHVIAGTRIPVNAIKRFSEAGYTAEQILKEYPDLTKEDVAAALKYKQKSSVA